MGCWGGGRGGPPALPGHAGLPALPPTVRQLCPFPDPTFGEILHSGLNHFLSRPHSQLWESGPEQRPGSFRTLLVALPSALQLALVGWGWVVFCFFFFNFLGSSQTVSSDPSPASFPEGPEAASGFPLSQSGESEVRLVRAWCRAFLLPAAWMLTSSSQEPTPKILLNSGPCSSLS